MHKAVYEFRDAVHGFVKLTKAEREIVDCPTFQRLRDIRQLAMAHLVYPGANHTRFEHSLGCLHLSTRVFDLLVEQQGRNRRPTFKDAFRTSEGGVERGRQILRLAALLHDLGHAPFSHSGEDLFPEVNEGGKSRRLDHEDMTARLIRDTEIGETIEKFYKNDGITAEHVIAVATTPARAKGQDPDAWTMFLNQILTGELGSDRIDYLLRDAHHSGQPSGVFDYDKLVNGMTLVPSPEQASGPEFRLGLDEAGWLVAEQMLVARYMMFVSVYFHKTKRIYELHLVDFLRAWLNERFGEPHWPRAVKDFVKLTDSAVISEIGAASRDKTRVAHQFAAPFSGRSHLRLAMEIVLADNFTQEEGGRKRPNAARFEALSKKILDNPPKSVRLLVGSNNIRIDTPDHSATKMFGPDSKILVLLDGKPRYIDDLSEIVSGMSSRIWRGRIYAPKADCADVKKLCEQYLDELRAAEEEDHG